jgi:hypothetical protein
MRRFVSIAGMLGLLLIIIGVAGTGHVATAAKPQAPRFVDNGDGTVTDTQTGLMWEQKTGTVGAGVVCSTATSCPDPTNVNNVYAWTATLNGTAADGPLFTDFLAKMNCEVLQVGGRCGPGVHRDWRIPTIAELQTIVDTSVAGCSAPPFATPCIDPIFGPTTPFLYWSSSSIANDPADAWVVFFLDGNLASDFKIDPNLARAVRGGS